MKEGKIILGAELPESYESTKASVEDEDEEPANTTAQPGSQSVQMALTPIWPESADMHLQNPREQQLSMVRSPFLSERHPPHHHQPKPLNSQSAESSKPTPYQGSCASPEYQALFVEWPFKAPSRGQTSMPPFIANQINNLPTKEERMMAKQLWNRSLPVAANVGIIEYNRVDAAKFKEKVDAKYSEAWWRRLEDLATGLNEAAGVIGGKVKGRELEGKVLDEGSGKGKEPGGKTVELPEGESKESEMKKPNVTGGKANEPETITLAHLAETAALAAETEEGSPPPPPSPSSLASTNPLSALWYLLTAFFASGPPAASYLFVTLEAAIRHSSTTVHPLHIPAPPSFWTAAADWTQPRVGLTLILTLASSEKATFAAFSRFSRSLSPPAPTADEMREKPTASLRKAVLRAKDDAERKRRTTVLGVNLRDVRYSELCEIYGKDAIEREFVTFGRMFALGICPGEGAKLWLVGGGWGEVGTVWEGNERVGPGVGGWDEMDEFVRAFEGVVGVNGQWNTKRFKWYHRCFAVDLKQFDLVIDEEERKKRGMVRKEGAKRLLNGIEAWVEIYKIEDVKVEAVGKFRWL